VYMANIASEIEYAEGSWNPPPREFATLVPNPQSNYSFYIIGGMNYTTIKEIAEL